MDNASNLRTFKKKTRRQGGPKAQKQMTEGNDEHEDCNEDDDDDDADADADVDDDDGDGDGGGDNRDDEFYGANAKPRGTANHGLTQTLCTEAAQNRMAVTSWTYFRHTEC